MYITQKELLEVTGVSLSQLQRWKRRGLIPESWFVKKSSEYGWEILLPREAAIERISFINENKATRSADEMLEMLRPGKADSSFALEELEQMSEIHPDVLSNVNAATVSKREAALLAIVSDVYRKYRLKKPDMIEFLTGCVGFTDSIGIERQEFLVVRAGTRLFSMMVQEGTRTRIDERLTLVEHYYVDRLAEELEKKYGTSAEKADVLQHLP